jgi:hypothetical protein
LDCREVALRQAKEPTAGGASFAYRRVLLRADSHWGSPPVKSNQRLDYSTLSEVLGQRGLIEPQRLSLALQTSLQSSIPFPEALVGENLIGDWELAKVVCDVYGLPFLPVDIYVPTPACYQDIDKAFLRQHRLVPVGRHGTLLVVAMPAIVQADVLTQLSALYNLRIVPVVGTVQSNNRWIEEVIPAAVAAALPADADSGGWGNIFDEGDAAVLLELNPGPDPFEIPSDGAEDQLG